jgi:hypothetical protein
MNIIKYTPVKKLQKQPFPVKPTYKDSNKFKLPVASFFF